VFPRVRRSSASPAGHTLIRTMQTTPNGNRYWLKEHQITAFWHGFGISNGGLYVPEQYVRKHKREYFISPQFMRMRLQEYIGWLKSYRQSWDDDFKHPCDADTREKFLQQEEERHEESRALILEMIELLQECRIDEA
jgi:hypothetical protein